MGSVCGRLYFGTSENIPSSELIDTTGAGDAFVGAVLYGTYIQSVLIIEPTERFNRLNCERTLPSV